MGKKIITSLSKKRKRERKRRKKEKKGKEKGKKKGGKEGNRKKMALAHTGKKAIALA